MEKISTLQRQSIVNGNMVVNDFNGSKFFQKKSFSKPVIDNLINEGGENFFHYISWHGLANESDMLLLSSRHHYFYDCDDLKGVKTIVNIKMLNLIKHLDSFIHTVNSVTSFKTNFIGCFYDSSAQNHKGLKERIKKRFMNFIDSKVFIEIDKKYVSRLMESNGFKVIDMTEINGITYFRTQNHNYDQKI